MKNSSLTSLEEETLIRCVNDGIALLDSVPLLNGWRDRLNFESLNIESCLFCVFGQLFGLYSDGIDFFALRFADDNVEIDTLWAAVHGFDVLSGFGGQDQKNFLRLAWQELSIV